MALSVASLFCLLLSITGGRSQDETNKEIFTNNLLKTLAGGKNENLIFSPVSLSTALAITATGARGTTQQQLYSALGYNLDNAKQVIAQQQQKLSEKPEPGAIWQSANRLLIAPDMKIKKSYLVEVSEVFPNTAVTHFDFRNPEKTANEVNSWVGDKTNQVIKQLLTPNDVKPNTRVIILNAVYFKGLWKYSFDKKRTKKECFFSSPGQCTMTDMMHIKQDYKYGYDNELKAQIIELPYKNENFSMVIVLPDEKYGNLNTLIGKLDVKKVFDFIDSKKWPVEVHLTLPKFEIETSKEMTEPLQQMGFSRMFDNPDFTGMVDAESVRVSSVIHKAKITVDEEGTEAAAATAVLTDRCCDEEEPAVVVADQPFLFMIRSNYQPVLFVGLKTV